jgi:hypothetical protein
MLIVLGLILLDPIAALTQEGNDSRGSVQQSGAITEGEHSGPRAECAGPTAHVEAVPSALYLGEESAEEAVRKLAEIIFENASDRFRAEPEASGTSRSGERAEYFAARNQSGRAEAVIVAERRNGRWIAGSISYCGDFFKRNGRDPR